jgi:transmembrane sensor
MENLSKDEFLEILRKYRLNTASAEEIELVHSYYEAFEVQPDILETMPEDEQTRIAEEIKSNLDMQLSFQERIDEKRHNRRVLIGWVVAASVAAIVFSVFLFNGRRKTREPVAQVATEAAASRKNNLVQLPDGSTVILSADSKIDYPTSFDKKAQRVVYLTGEAYFDIQSNPAKPFIVHTGKLVTTVLGTAFNIRALPGEKSITVTVTRGAVKVANENRTFSILHPQEQITYSIEKDEAVQESVNAEKIVEWTENDLYFDDITISTAADILEKRFLVKIRVTDEHLKNQRFTTTFNKEESLESILTSIGAFSNASFKMSADKKEITLSPK